MVPAAWGESITCFVRYSALNEGPVGRMSKPRALLSWSSGKDSAWALHVLRQEAAYEIVGLVTTINAPAARVAMHAVRT